MKSCLTSDWQFCELKKEILDIIYKSEKVNTKGNENSKSGIYLLYVDNFEDEKIIPFYIGKAVDFKKRFQSHLKDIKSLMKYDYARYHNAFFWSAVSFKRVFEGKYRPCKILKYIVDHDCSLESVKMVILETCEVTKLDERERYYLSVYLPAYFGFNQIFSITEQFIYRDDAEKMRQIIDEDVRLFQKYMEYGYSAFNYLHAFGCGRSKELDDKANLLLSNKKWLPREELYSLSVSSFKHYQQIYEIAYKIIREKYAMRIHEVFEKYRFKSAGREKDVLAAFTNHMRTNIINDVDENLNYLEYYFDRNTKSRECGKMITELYNSNADEIAQIIEPVKIAFVAYVDSKKRAIEQSEYSIIFPRKVFCYEK